MGLFSKIFGIGKRAATYASDRAQDAAEVVVEKTGDVVTTAREAAGNAVETVVEKVSDAADSVETRVKSRRAKKKAEAKD